MEDHDATRSFTCFNEDDTGLTSRQDASMERHSMREEESGKDREKDRARERKKVREKRDKESACRSDNQKCPFIA